ncbi:hypothetical protein LTR95_009173, partial [Oleoguttula sp. CCFEE 5521]
IQIHESKFGQRIAKQYSTNLHFEGTALRKRNNIMACSGASLATAKRYFENAFLELTGVRWTNRENGPDERRSSETIKLERRMFKYQGDEEVPGANAGGATELDLDVGQESDLQWPPGPKSPDMHEIEPVSTEGHPAASSTTLSDGNHPLTTTTAEPPTEPLNDDFSTNITVAQLAATEPTFGAVLTQDKNYDWSAGMNFETQPPVNFYDPSQTFTLADPFDLAFGDPSFAQHASFIAEDSQTQEQEGVVGGLTGSPRDDGLQPAESIVG